MSISVVIPFKPKENPEYLYEAISSLNRYQFQEIIVVDDWNSDQNAIDVLESVSQIQNVKVIKSIGVGKITLARATGIFNASGDYVMLMDHDDTVEGELDLELVEINLAHNPTVTKIVHPLDYISNPFAIWGLIAKKELLQHIPFEKLDDYHEDFATGIHLFLQAFANPSIRFKFSGLKYNWRVPINRKTFTSTLTYTENERRELLHSNFLKVLESSKLTAEQLELSYVWHQKRLFPDRYYFYPVYRDNATFDVIVHTGLVKYSDFNQVLEKLEIPCNIFVAICGKSKGTAIANLINEYLEKSPSNWVIILDGDLEINPKTLSYMISVGETEDKHILACNITTPEDNLITPIPNTSKKNLDVLAFDFSKSEAFYVINKKFIFNSSILQNLPKYDRFAKFYLYNMLIREHPEQYKYFDMLGGWYLNSPNFDYLATEYRDELISVKKEIKSKF